MGLASHRCVERFEAPGGIQQQGWRVAATPAGERDLRAQPLQPGAVKLVERGKLGGRQQLERLVRCRSIELRLGSGQSTSAPLRGSGVSSAACARNAAAAAAPPRACARSAERSRFGGHRLVNPHRRVSAMPRKTIGIGLRINRLRQRPMRSSPLGMGGRPVYRGSDQRMPETGTGPISTSCASSAGASDVLSTPSL